MDLRFARLCATPFRRKERGFSLLELLVVTAILTVVVSGVVAVFLGSMKAVRQGYRHMDAYEMTRGAFQVVERDLSGAFTSRDFGDYYQFYGAPYGMTFVGVANNYQGINANPNANLCRVSYVIRQISDDPIHDPDPLDAVLTNDGPRPAFVLIRYVELGIDNLDAFPVDWTGEAYGVNDPESPTHIPAQNMVEELTTIRDMPGITVEEKDRLLATKKRELWLRMLRGNGPVYADELGTEYTGGGPAVPDPVPDFFRTALNFNASYANLNIRDYVVVTNIVLSDDQTAPIVREGEIDLTLPFGIKAFHYGLPVNRPVSTASRIERFGQHDVLFSTFWNAEQNLDLFVGGTPTSYGGEGSPLWPRLPAAVHLHMRLKFPAPNVAAAEIERVLDETIDVPTAFTRAQLGFS